jgi:general secretion pathway protein D
LAFQNEFLAHDNSLGDIPVIGQAFRTDRTTRSKTELYIVVTPHIVHHIGATTIPANAPLYAPTTTTVVPIGGVAARPQR